MTYRSSLSFERQPTALHYDRAIWRVQMQLKMQGARVLAYAALIEALELQIAELEKKR